MFPSDEDYQEPAHSGGNLTRKSVLLFIAAVVTTVVAVTTVAAFIFWSIWSSRHQADVVQHQISAASQQWCTTLDLLTKTPVPKPADPKANPSRESGYELYLTFMNLRHRFGCQ